MVSLVELKSKLSIIGLAINKTAQAIKTLVSLHGSFYSHVHTLTYDTGPEFAYHKLVDNVLNRQGNFHIHTVQVTED